MLDTAYDGFRARRDVVLSEKIKRYINVLKEVKSEADNCTSTVAGLIVHLATIQSGIQLTGGGGVDEGSAVVRARHATTRRSIDEY